MSIKSEKIQALLERALETETARDLGDLYDAIDRASSYPSARPNFALAAAVGIELARRDASRKGVVDFFLGQKSAYFVRVGIFYLAERAAKARKIDGGLAELGAIDVTVHEVRAAVADAVAHVLVARTDETAAALQRFTGGYLQAVVALDALTRPEVLTKLSDDRELLARFDEAFVLADTSSRGDDRTQGCRQLRADMPGRLALAARRFSSVITFVRDRLDVKRPESRELLRATVDDLRRSKISDPEAARLLAELDRNAPAPRDPTLKVKGTRNRSRGRRA